VGTQLLHLVVPRFHNFKAQSQTDGTKYLVKATSTRPHSVMGAVFSQQVTEAARANDAWGHTGAQARCGRDYSQSTSMHLQMSPHTMLDDPPIDVQLPRVVIEQHVCHRADECLRKHMQKTSGNGKGTGSRDRHKHAHPKYCEGGHKQNLGS